MGISVLGYASFTMQNWLGDLLPDNAKELPPVPEESLRIHGEEGKSQVAKGAVE